MFNATMQFDLGEDVNALREMVHRWAQERAVLVGLAARLVGGADRTSHRKAAAGSAAA